MKQFWKDLCYSCMMGLIVPGMVLSVGIAMFGENGDTPEPTIAQIVHQKEPNPTMIRVLTEDGIQEMELKDYLTGVVLAEMPASFEFEAHKAQAVVARTYTMRAESGKGKHEDAVVCTDSACCQGYISEADYLRKGGTREGVDQIRSAVEETDGQVLLYEGELIEATYFSCSGGYTEDAVAVWGTDVPYLKSVASPGEEEATHYSDTVTFEGHEFLTLLDLQSDEPPGNWIGEIRRTAGGSVDTIEICGEVFQGTAVRKALGLRSAAFSVEVEKDTLIITTRGYGHRVGMSQYGADAMAASGSDYREILAHYYQGTTLGSLSD